MLCYHNILVWMVRMLLAVGWKERHSPLFIHQQFNKKAGCESRHTLFRVGEQQSDHPDLVIQGSYQEAWGASSGCWGSNFGSSERKPRGQCSGLMLKKWGGHSMMQVKLTPEGHCQHRTVSWINPWVSLSALSEKAKLFQKEQANQRANKQ